MLELECDHPDFECTAGVGRISEVDGGPITHFNVQITVRCTRCNLPFEWIGPPWAIVDANGACVSMDRTELRIPIEPKGKTMRGPFSMGAHVDQHLDT